MHKMNRKRKVKWILMMVSIWLILALIAIKSCMAWDSIQANEGNISVLNFFDTFTKYLLFQFSAPFSLTWNQASIKAVLFVSLIWLVFAIYVYDLVNKNFYAKGAVHGTSVWGKLKDIKDLFAKNIMKKEIFRVKLLRFAIGRFFAKRRALKTSKEQSNLILNFELEKLQAEKNRQINLHGLSDEERDSIALLYKRKAVKLKETAEERVNVYFAEYWKPYKLKLRLDEELAEINENYVKGLEISTKAEKEAAENLAKQKYDSAIKEFKRGRNAIDELRMKYANADALFTKTERISIYNWVLNNNSLINGGSSSGKTRSFVLPNILQAHSSYIITDPKGEILQKVGFFLEHIAGYKIRVMNLYKLSSSDGYNPFVYVHTEREGYETRILSLIEALIINTDGGEQHSRDPFWPSAERLFLQSIFFFVCDGFPAEERNMSTVMSLIRMLEIEETGDKKNSDLDYFVDIFAEAHGEEHVGVKNYREFRAFASGKTAMSIVASAVARLRTFDVPEVERIFRYDTMHLERVGEEKTAIFVVVPPMEKTFNFVAGMMFTQLFQEIQYCATEVHKHDGMRVPVPVRFILDEFATTCTIPNFTEILAYARSLGVGITPIIQSLSQLKKIYEKDWGVIVDNCGAFLFLGSVTHDETLDYISEKLLGKGTWDKKTIGRSSGRNQSENKNFDEIGRVLMDSSELRRMPKKDCILIVNGRNPFYSEKYDYTQHPNYCFTSDANPAHSYDYVPPAPPKTKQELAEEEDCLRKTAVDTAHQILSEIDESDNYSSNADGYHLLRRLGDAFPYLQPIREELWELEDDSDESIFSLLGFENEDTGIDSILSESRRLADIKLEKINEDIETSISEELYDITTDSVEVAKSVLSTGQNLVPIRDNLFDGDIEDTPNESVTIDDAFGEDIEGLDILLSELEDILKSNDS